MQFLNCWFYLMSVLFYCFVDFSVVYFAYIFNVCVSWLVRFDVLTYKRQLLVLIDTHGLRSYFLSVTLEFDRFLPERHYVTFGYTIAISSVVCNVGALGLLRGLKLSVIFLHRLAS